MNFRITFLIVALVSSAIFCDAQQAKLRRAAEYMDNYSFVDAIALYNEILEEHDVSEAKINLAEAYRRVNDTENAEYWYGQAVRVPESKPIHKLYYGQMLQSNGKCDLAREWFQKYVEEVPGDLRGQYLVKACDYEEELLSKNGTIYTIRHLDVNSDLDDFGPAIHKDKLIFSSERDKGAAVKRIHTWTEHPFLELYQVDVANTAEDNCVIDAQYGRPEKYSRALNTKFHEAIVTYADNGKTVFWTRNNYKDGKIGKSDEGIVKLKVYYATGGEDNWYNEESLPFNSDEYSVAHPSITADGNRLFFSSDMPGGFGGMDLYVSENENGRWGPPMNLGPSINTEGNEIFPYYRYTEDGSYLYFSSDGQIGLGGLDIYYMEDKEEGWGSIENVGYPINTTSDDFGIVYDKSGACGYFSSDRPGGTGRDDIYSFAKNASPVQILVYDETTGEPIEGATVKNECTGLDMVTGEDGRVLFEVALDTCCNFVASMETYDDNAKEACTKNVKRGETIFLEIPLQRSMEFVIAGTVYDQITGRPLEGVEVKLENYCAKETPAVVYTDISGQYEFQMYADCCHKLNANKTGYFGTPVDDQCTDGLSESTTFTVDMYLSPIVAQDPTDVVVRDPAKPVTPDDPGQGDFPVSPRDVKPGEPVAYLLHIYYDFDQAYIRDEAKVQLDKLCTVLNENPGFIVEIGSHTDARGSHAYNIRLSQRRAESVVHYLTNNCRIDRSRLVPRGYGEETTVNKCVNKVPCTEKEHQLNRRTEFRIIGCTDCDVPKGVISKPEENPRVDPCQGCPF